MSPIPGVAHVEEHERKGGDADQKERGSIRGGVGKFLDLVVDGDGESACGAGDVAANHENHAELADGVGETKCRGRDHRMDGERQKYAGQNAESARSQEAALLDECCVDGAKSSRQGLHGERKAIEDGTNDEAGKRKSEWMPKQA